MSNITVASPSESVSDIDTTTEYAEDPDNDSRCHPQTLSVAILYVLMISVGWGFMLVQNARGLSTLLALFSRIGKGTIAGLFFLAYVGLLGVILFSLMIEAYLVKQRLRLQIILQAMNLVFFAASYILVTISKVYCDDSYAPPECYYDDKSFRAPDTYGFGLYLNPVIYGFGLYAMCVVVYRFFA